MMKIKNGTTWPVAAVVVLALCLPLALFGQSISSAGSGTVVGVITDPSGAVVPGATVTLTDRGTGTSRTATTNADGRYLFVAVPTGSYDVNIAKSGFATAKVPNQSVRVGTTSQVNASLQVGAQTTTVTVEAAEGAELQTLNSTVGTTLESKEIVMLPNIGRDTSTLLTLQPATGVNGNTAGAVMDQNSFTLDGGSVTDDMSGDNNTYIPSFSSDTTGGIAGTRNSGVPGQGAAPSGIVPTPVDTIEELKVNVTNQTADFNQGAGSQVQMVTKRGTSAFHGSGYEYYFDSKVGGANTWDNNSINKALPSTHYSRFGVTAGGQLPIGSHLGGNTYLFGAYEGFRYPLSQSFEHNYPTASLRAGLVKIGGQVINLNPTATVDPATGATIAPTPCGANPTCDPRGIGINPNIQAFWNQYLPLPNDLGQGDGLNYAGYLGTIALPQSSNFGVVRLDHDFGQKLHFNSTYHYYHFTRATTNQVDVGGFFPGDTKGQYKSTSTRPQEPWLYTGQLTANVTSSVTNVLNYSGTRNWWAYQTHGGVPNVAGYPATWEIGGESNTANWTPFNTNNQSSRTRFWNGHDNVFRDDVSFLRGNHLLQFGGQYQRNHDTHQRIDNGGFINIYEQYLIGQGNSAVQSGVTYAGFTPAGITSKTKYRNLASEVMGIVSETQTLYTRTPGSTLALRPQTSCAIAGIAATAGCIASPPALNSSIIPGYNLYFGDTWHVKPKLTVTYGISWTTELPPLEPNGNQSLMVDSTGHELITDQYLAARKSAALQGVAYDPLIGFDAIGNVPGHPKYPYNPYYNGFAPNVSVAWNPTANTVIRGGYRRLYGRINGVDQVLVPILAPGLMQTVQCFGPVGTGAGAGTACGGTVANVFRVGIDGTKAAVTPASANLPQPWYPGFNDAHTGAGEGLDPSFRPNVSDQFNLSIQRQMGSKITAEIGYIGRRIRHEFQAYNLNAVPYMMTQGGQTFAQAWAAVMQQTNLGVNIPATVTAQPFFETALGGTGSAFCTGSPNCTTAFVNAEASNMSSASAWSAWTDMSTAGNWVFGRSMTNDPIPTCGAGVAGLCSTGGFGANGQGNSLFLNESNGYGNYHAVYGTLNFRDWHGLTMRHNFTWSKALGTGAVVQATSAFTVIDPWNLHNMYGTQIFDQKLNYNMFFNYALPFYKSQQGLAGHILGGWSWSSVFTAGSGVPVEANTANGDAEAFGEGSGNDMATFENAVLLGSIPTPSRHQGVCGAIDPNLGKVGTAGKCQNAFSNPLVVANAFRQPILGLDSQIGGGGPFYGLPYWNVDMSLQKNLKITERINTNFYFQALNVFNHMQPNDPLLDFSDPTTFGVLGGGGNVQGNLPRRMEFGIRVAW